MPLVANNQKEFEKPPSGTYVGTIADVVELGEVADAYGKKFKLRIVWLLNKNDSEGRPFQVMKQVNQTMANKPKESNLYTLVRKVIGGTPTIPYDTDQLIGRSNVLFIEQEKAANGNIYANIKAILPLEPDSRPIAIPTTFVRAQDKAKQGQQTAQPPAQAQQTAPSTAPSTATAVADEIPF